MIRRPPRSTLFPYRRSSDLLLAEIAGTDADAGRLAAAGLPPDAAVALDRRGRAALRSEEHTSELQSRLHLVCRLLLEKKKHTAGHRRIAQTPAQRAVPLPVP